MKQHFNISFLELYIEKALKIFKLKKEEQHLVEVFIAGDYLGFKYQNEILKIFIGEERP